MNIVRSTVSLCPTCYKRIPAHIAIEDGLWMYKACSEHGMFKAMVEHDPDFYAKAMLTGNRILYSGHFIDITERCNLKCNYCYFPINNKAQDRSIDSILQEAAINQGPIFLSGGEPLIHDDIAELIERIQKIHPVFMLTNGTMLTWGKTEQLIPLLCANDRVMRIGLSLHSQAARSNERVLTEFRERKLKFESVQVVIDSIEEVPATVVFCEAWKDVIVSCRIKIAAKIWNEDKPQGNIFTSDVVNALSALGAVPVWWKGNKATYFHMALNGLVYIVVYWHTVENIDLLDKDCPPTYTAKTGQVMGIASAFLINEGISKGYLNGVKLWESQDQ